MKTKRETFMYSLLEFPEMQKRLEQRAAEGWRLKKVGSFFWIYEEAEPKKVHYSIVFFPKTNNLEPEPSDSLMMLREYCEKTGWELAAEQGQMQIFCNEQPNPVPIETEAWIQVKNIHETMKKSIVLVHGILLVNAVLQLGIQAMQFFTNPLDWLSMGFNFYMIWCWVFLGAGSAVEIIHYYAWYKKAKRMAEEEEILYLPKSIHLFRIIYLTIAMAALVLAILVLTNFTTARYGIVVLVWTVVVLGVPMSVSKLLKKRKVSAKWNRVIIMILAFVCTIGMTIVIFISVDSDANLIFRRDEEALLTLSDFIEIDEEKLVSSTRKSDSIFLFREECYQSKRWEEDEIISVRSKMDYTLIMIKIPFLYDFCKEELMAEKNQYIEYVEEDFEDQSGYRKVDMPVWGAEEVYQYYEYDGNPENEYLICYLDRILQIDFGWDVTDEDIEKVRDIIMSERDA